MRAFFFESFFSLGITCCSLDCLIHGVISLLFQWFINVFFVYLFFVIIISFLALKVGNDKNEVANSMPPLLWEISITASGDCVKGWQVMFSFRISGCLPVKN